MLPGPSLPEGVLEDDGTERGLMFVFTGTSIRRRQFESVQSEWVNNGMFIGSGSDKTLLQEPAMTQERLSSHANQSERASRTCLGSSSHAAVNIVLCQAYVPYVG
jgi:hypothetical protein